MPPLLDETRQTAEHLALASLNALSAHIAILDETGMIVAVNDAWRAFAEANDAPPGTTYAGVNYLAVCDATPGPEAAEAAAIAAGIRAVRHGAQAEFALEYPCHAPTEHRWFIARVTRFSWQGTLRLVVAHENITERKLAEVALRESERRYRSLFENTFDAILLADNQGHYVEVNRAATQLLGYTREEFLAMSVWDLTPDANREQGLALWQAFIRQGHLQGEYQLLHKTGRRMQFDFQATAEVLPGLHLSVLHNTTERKQAEEALRESEARLQGLVNSATDSILMLDSQQRITLFNPAAEQTFGYAARDILGQPLDGLLPLPQRTRHGQHVQTFGASGIMARQMTSATTFYALRANGEVFPCEVSISQNVVRGEKFFAAILRDITLRQQTENALRAAEVQTQALQEIDRLRSELIANVSHELRTPLGLIMVLASSLLRPTLTVDAATQTEFLQGIVEETERLTAIVENLLEIARLQNGPVRLALHLTELTTLTTRVLTALQPQLAQHRVVFTPPAPLQALLDGPRFEQVLRNLLTNAAKYSAPGTTITVRLCATPTEAVWQVQDEGVGLVPEDRLRLFERFYRAKQEAVQRVPGAGLGLAISHSIVTAHHGRIWAEPATPCGSIFSVALPLT